jgi:MAF protein
LGDHIVPSTTASRPQLILASSSPYRRALLEQVGLLPTCHAPNIDESAQKNERAGALARRLSIAKAQAVAKQHPNSLIIASDQCAELHQQILGKPGTTERARQQLNPCSGHEVVFHTGLCLLNSRTGQIQECVETATTAFRSLSHDEIEAYIHREPALDCAGSFKMEGLGISLFRYIRSDDPNTLIGLPLIRLIDFLKKENYSLL